MAEEMLELVKQVGEATAGAFNRGDFEAAFGYLPPDFESQPPSEFPDSRVLRGPEEIAGFYCGAAGDLSRLPERGFQQLVPIAQFHAGRITRIRSFG